MKLEPKEFKRFKELSAKAKAKKITPEEEAELAELTAKRNTKGSNDLAWWKNYPELLKDVVNLPFNWIPGTTVVLTDNAGTPVQMTLGVIAIAKTITAIGHSVSEADAYNSQIRQLWIDMHRKYRGIGTYQKSDLGIMILSVHSLFETIAKFERIYGVINSYHIGNRVVPQGLKEALGIDQDLEDNLAEFRYTLNLYIEKCRQLCLPKGISMLMADIIAQGNLFKDSDNRRAFIFGFDNDEFGVYDGTLVNTGGQAIGSAVKFRDYAVEQNGVTPGGQSAFTLADIRNILNSQVTALLNDDDIQTMCSDLLAAYGPENVMTLQSVPTEYKVEPVQDYERSLQFHNLTIVGSTASIYDSTVIDLTMAGTLLAAGYDHVIYQKDNTILNRIGKGKVGYVAYAPEVFPKFSTNSKSHGKRMEVLFDTWVDNPGETELMCGTRYSSLVGPRVSIDSNYSRQEVTVYGGKVVEEVSVFSYASAYGAHYIRGTVMDESEFTGNLAGYVTLLQMDWAPILYFDDGAGVLSLVGDIDNFTRIDYVNLERLHEVALLSGYKISMVSKE